MKKLILMKSKDLIQISLVLHTLIVCVILVNFNMCADFSNYHHYYNNKLLYFCSHIQLPFPHLLSHVDPVW